LSYNQVVKSSYTRNALAGFAFAIVGIVVVTIALTLPGEAVNPTTAALMMLLVILLVATFWDARPAIAASAVAILSLNFFFLPPTGTFAISDPHNWIALFAFLVTAITAGQLSRVARRRADEAEAGRREIERLYDELRTAFERASHAEALRQSERLKSALLDAVTHDIRTPLTSIKASVTTLLEEAPENEINGEPIRLDDEGRREMLEIINEECDRLNRFVEGLIELARIEAGQLQLRRHWGTIEEMISSALERASKLTVNHRIVVEIERELPAARVDARAVSEVIYTLVDNAAKYSQPGATIRVTARAADEIIRVAVEDEGCGIPVELRERVFDKFFRAMRAGDVASSGTGLGLAIARGIVEAHGGRIWIEERASGRGSRVVFTLPTGDEATPEEREQNIRTPSHALALDGGEQEP
jgi:two-component system sensor histidine kinase KdpD